MSTDADFDFVIEDGVVPPKREIVGRVRVSRYRIDQMKQGQGAFITLVGEDGHVAKDKDGNEVELTAAQDLERQQRQKQSYFSQLGKKLGIKIKTATYTDGSKFSARNAGKAGIGVWHMGPRVDTADTVEVTDGAEH